jgi:hypothetical protein
MSKRMFFLAILILSSVLLAACGSAGTGTSSQVNTGNASAASGPDADGDGIPDSAEPVLGTDPQNPDTDGDGQNDLEDAAPLSADNPIQENSMATGFTIDAIAVENNVDASGAGVPDHLELTVSNTTGNDISGFDIYYTLTDTVTGTVQSFYQSLPDLVLAANETAHLHFDTTSNPDHFRADPNSMFYTGQHALTVNVVLHANGFAPQMVSVGKDDPSAEAGGD